MKKLVILAILLSTQTHAQSIIGINVDLGNSKIVNSDLGSINSLSSNTAWNIATNANFITSKRFNSKISIGYGEKKSTQTFLATFGNNLYDPEKLVTVTTLQQLRLDVGVRFNILNKKHKLFIDLSLANNYIVKVKNIRAASATVPSANYESNPSSPYYVSLPVSLGYNFNNYFSIAAMINPGLTSFDNYTQAKVNMWGINLCYYLPIFGNRKSTSSSVEK